MADFVCSFDNFGDIVSDLIKFAVGGVDGLEAFLHFGFKPTIERFPKRFADEEDWHFGHFAFLHEELDFGEFVECAVAAREEDINFRAHSKHYFSGEEVVKLHLIGDVRINVLLVRKGDIEADTTAACFVSAAVGCFHDARSAAGNDWVAILGEEIAKLVG